MIFKIMAVRDRAADVFGVPHFQVSLGAAIRSFGDEINREAENNAFYRHPEDFDLYELGTFDDQDGSFVTQVPKQVAIGKDLVLRSRDPAQVDFLGRNGSGQEVRHAQK